MWSSRVWTVIRGIYMRSDNKSCLDPIRNDLDAGRLKVIALRSGECAFIWMNANTTLRSTGIDIL